MIGLISPAATIDAEPFLALSIMAISYPASCNTLAVTIPAIPAPMMMQSCMAFKFTSVLCLQKQLQALIEQMHAMYFPIP